MNTGIIRQFAVILALIVTLAINTLANTLPINGQTSADIANRLPIYFVPANYVFSIWGVIYLLLIGYAVYQALPAQRDNPRLRSIGYLFVLSSIANSVWLVLFHYEFFPLTMIAMLILLLTLIAIYLRLGIGKTAISRTERWFSQLPFSVYLGWITVATIANASYVLYDANWDGFGISGPVWAAIMIVIAAGVTLAIIALRRDVAYAAVIVWALVGIVVKQGDTALVAGTAGLMTGVIALAVLITLFRLRPARGQ